MILAVSFIHKFYEQDMIVYFVVCFIYTTQVDCVTRFNKALNDLTDSVNCVIAAHPFFETKLFLSEERNSLNFSLTQTLNGLFSRTTWVGRYQKDKPFWILLKQEMMGWPWHQLNHMQIICTCSR